MKLLEPLGLETKLELLSKLSASLQAEIHSTQKTDRERLLAEVWGAWKDTDENLALDILASRSYGDDSINLDE